MKYSSLLLLSTLVLHLNSGSTLAHLNGLQTVSQENVEAALQPASWSWQFVSAPLGDAKIEGILVDPEDDRIWYVSTLDQGLYITRDGGQSWEHPLQGRGLDMEGYQIAPANPDKLYATLWDKLYVSEDKGLRWTELYTCPEYIRSLHISRVDNSIYLGPQTEQNNSPGVYKSVDGGQSFQHYSFGVATHNLICWDIEEDAKHGVLYISVEIADHPQPYQPPFFRSYDGGQTWTNVAGVIPWHALKVQVDGANRQLYYLAERGGLYKSANDGDDWQFIPVYAMFLFMDPQNPARLYAGDNASFGDGGAWFSGNAGLSFSAIGLPDLTVVSLTTNAANTKLYAACYNSGIWIAEIPQAVGGLLVTNSSDSGPGSLREAIENANANPGADTLRFAIPISDAGYDESRGTWTIQPENELPMIADDSLFVDGASQSAFIGSESNTSGPEIVIDGSQTGSNGSGFFIASANNRFSNLVINNFSGSGIWTNGEQAKQNTISGCYIGLDAGGTLMAPNGLGIYISESADNLIGGTAAESRNIISGNSTSGILVIGEQAGGNRILGNTIGLTASGSIGLGNQWMGIDIVSDDNIIGGSQAGAGNVISGNGNDGIRISGSSNMVKGNYLGTDITGSVAIGNNWDGIMVYGTHTIIGGAEPGEHNLISGNKKRGILFNGGDDNQVLGNYIGTDITGQNNLGNLDFGVGLYFGAQRNVVGPRNIIAFNAMGVQVFSDSSFSNTITENSIFNNAGVGISTFNSNNNISSPVIAGATGSLVSGTATANATVEIFSDAAGEGKTYEGKVIADGNGAFTWNGSVTGPNVTATATDATGNTSGFSLPHLVTAVEQISPALPESFSLQQNYPNPFNPGTTIAFTLPRPARVSLKLFNLAGQEVATLVTGHKQSGEYKLSFEDDALPSGVYLYRLTAWDGQQAFAATKKLTLLK